MRVANLNLCVLQAEVYVNLLDGESVDDDSLLNIVSNSKSLEKSEESATKIRESDESSVSTLSTIQSKLTPKSSFSQFDAQTVNNFDLAKLLDPFEQLEREFNWDDVTMIRPPSAFSSMIDVNENNNQQENNNSAVIENNAANSSAKR